MNWRIALSIALMAGSFFAGRLVCATPITVIGVGNTTCEVWRDPARGGMRDHNAASSWVAGYIFGVASEQDYDLLKTQNRASIDAAVDYYCSQHPMDKVVDAAQYLGGELKKRAAMERVHK